MMNLALKDSKGNLNKGVVFGGVALLGLAGFGIYKVFFAKSEAEKKKEQEEQDKQKQIEDNTENSQKKQSERETNDTEAKQIAEDLYLAMKDLGTDEDKIEELLLKRKLRSLDYTAIYNAFGKKKYGTYGSPMFSWMDGDLLDLRQWLEREVSSSLYEKLNQCFRQAGFDGFGFVGCI